MTDPACESRRRKADNGHAQLHRTVLQVWDRPLQLGWPTPVRKTGLHLLIGNSHARSVANPRDHSRGNSYSGNRGQLSPCATTNKDEAKGCDTCLGGLALRFVVGRPVASGAATR